VSDAVDRWAWETAVLASELKGGIVKTAWAVRSFANDKGGIYFYNDWKSTTPWGDTRPDYGRPEVRDFIKDNALFWLEEYHLDGLRFDMTLYIRNVKGDEDDPNDSLEDGWRLMRWINDEIRERVPGRITIAEDLRRSPAITAPDGAGFGAQWCAEFVHPVREVLIARDDAQVACPLTVFGGTPREVQVSCLERWRLICDGRYKLITTAGRHGAEPDRVELFDLIDDAAETVDLAVQEPELAGRLLARLDAETANPAGPAAL